MLDEAGLTFPSYGLIATEETIAERGEGSPSWSPWSSAPFMGGHRENPDLGVEAIIAQRPDANLNRMSCASESASPSTISTPGDCGQADRLAGARAGAAKETVN
ncbi:MAG: hypothetical protein R3C69_04085 [Geminicoccaceae bacterium]